MALVFHVVQSERGPGAPGQVLIHVVERDLRLRHPPVMSGGAAATPIPNRWGSAAGGATPPDGTVVVGADVVVGAEVAVGADVVVGAEVVVVGACVVVGARLVVGASVVVVGGAAACIGPLRFWVGPTVFNTQLSSERGCASPPVLNPQTNVYWPAARLEGLVKLHVNADAVVAADSVAPAGMVDHPPV